MEAGKVMCTECYWRGFEIELLQAKNPFEDGEIIHACPICKSIESFNPICDEKGCWLEVSCGTQTQDGYRSVCGKHWRDLIEKK